jgi:hypothetical protein
VAFLSDHRRLVQINEIAQMEKTRYAVPAALCSGLGEIDIDCLVWALSRSGNLGERGEN